MTGAHYSTTVPNDSGYGRMITIEALGLLKVGRIQILRPVREEVEAGHQKDGVDAQKPVVLDHRTGLADEHASLLSSTRASLALQRFCANEDFTLRHEGPNNCGKGGYSRRRPEERAPG